MGKYVLFILFIFNIEYFVGCQVNKIKFQTDASKYNIKDGDTCITQGGKQGTCLPMHKCSEIKELVKSRGGIHTEGTADIVRKRICNFELKEARVCCLPETISDNPILPTHEECGLISVIKIVGGKDFSHGVHPWLVGIGYLQGRDKKSIKVKCGGTLITKRHVLTAAHCFNRTHNRHLPHFTHVILGEHSLSEESESKPPIILQILERRNPGYNVTNLSGDLELLTLEKDVEFNDYIRPACLPFEQFEKKFDFSRNVTVAGWGKTAYVDFQGTDRPKHAELPPIPLDLCKIFYEENFPNILIDETQICLGGNGKDTCTGDSGGPVIYLDIPNSFRYYVVGITAFGIDCGNPDFPGVYTYVPAYINWILENL